MTPSIEIRASGNDDLAALREIYREAFPAEDLLPLVTALLDDASATLSLVAVVDGAIAGHALFTLGRVGASGCTVALLGPLAVAAPLRRSGIGRALVEAGCAAIAERAVERVLVLGGPAYYGRLGFRPEAEIEPLYPLPAAWRTAWQSRRLRSPLAPCRGKLHLPRPWQQPALWSP